MLSLYDDPNYEDVQTCHLYAALEAAMQIQKKKIIVGPNDSVGILLFNTVRLKLCGSIIVFEQSDYSRPESRNKAKAMPQKSRETRSFINQSLHWARPRFRS
jgi:hypothetical protein